MEKGHTSVERFWLVQQDTALIDEPELRGLPLNLLLYTSEYLRLMCYSETAVPPPDELLDKTCSFLRQLRAGNWNLNLTESGNPVAVDVEMLDILPPENQEDVYPDSNEAVTEEPGSLDTKSDSEEFYVQDFSSTDF
ncbi:hypothetical protein ANANG_G00152490 [Anguilla anguilla]|uniref:Uncharacterized protein n=1 Tax=Anguilla anguilla TaxID=7936 RepID=A0A9D3M9Y9_ANGAN|nr:hypothetical protein ANANG_G00152490 [Anguilla anguilla]